MGTMRQVVIYPGEDGQWIGEVPSLPGCCTQGATKAEVLELVKDAIAAWLEAAKTIGRDIPAESFDAQICVI